MEKKRGPKGGLEAFFAGKGFYIVLSLCVVIIGVSAWAMLSGTGTHVETPANNDLTNLEVYGQAEYTPSEPQAPEIQDNGVLAPSASPAVTASPAVPSQTPADNTQADPTELSQQEDSAAVWSADDGGLEAEQVFYWPVNGEIEIPYSVDTLIYNRTLSDWRTHPALDIAAAMGTQVMAAGSGRVENIYTDDLYGVTVVIDHMGGLKSIYSNLAETPTVYVGDGVIAGEIIGAVGSTALGETGEVTHLHFAMTLDGQSVDPTEYLP